MPKAVYKIWEDFKVYNCCSKPSPRAKAMRRPARFHPRGEEPYGWPGPLNQRSRQCRTGDHRGANPSRHAPSLGIVIFLRHGPTSVGRPKPDLLAPGKKILSCATGKLLQDNQPCDHKAKLPNYIESSGTSMAAPHVYGCIASFLSVKREFIGRPDRVKEMFLATATDLGRECCFRGAGLGDLMRAIQNI